MRPACALAWLVAVGCGPADPSPQARALDPSILPDPDALMFARLDRDRSGRVTSDELRDRHAQAAIEAWDTDRSGDLDPQEVAASMSGPPPGTQRGRGRRGGNARGTRP